jgi:leader peptidase (prepilin peptidase)/N-methyltransferase
MASNRRAGAPAWPLALGLGGAASLAAAFEFGSSGRTLAAVLLLATLAALSAIDVEERRIPNRIVLPAAAVMLVLQVVLEPGRAFEWAAAALGAAALLFVLSVVNPDGLGMGDVKLALLLGAALGGAVVAALALGSVLAGLFGVALLVRHGVAARRSTIPLAPFLAVGATVVLLLA